MESKDKYDELQDNPLAYSDEDSLEEPMSWEVYDFEDIVDVNPQLSI